MRIRLLVAPFEFDLVALRTMVVHPVRRLIPAGTQLYDRHYQRPVDANRDQFVARIEEWDPTQFVVIKQAAAKGGRRYEWHDTFEAARKSITKWYERRFALIANTHED